MPRVNINPKTKHQSPGAAWVVGTLSLEGVRPPFQFKTRKRIRWAIVVGVTAAFDFLVLYGIQRAAKYT